MFGLTLGLGPMRPLTGAVAVAPANTGSPTIAGAATQGQTLSATTGSWAGTAPISFAYQWQRGEVVISGATFNSYVLQSADVGAVLRVVVAATSRHGTAVATSAGTAAVAGIAQTLATLPVAPTARWHPAHSTVVQSGGRVVSASDLQGLAGLTEGAAGIGPFAMTDALGKKFWRFKGSEYLNFAAALTYTARNQTVFFIGRNHRSTTNNHVLSGTGVSAASLEMSSQGGSIALPRAGRAMTSATANTANMVCGAQLSLVGAAAGASSIRYFVDAEETTTTQAGVNATIVGGQIGRLANNPGTSGYWGIFDLYELVIYNRVLTDAEARSVRDALLANYAITPKTNQLMLAGDSITQGISVVDSGFGSGMVLSDPGVARPGWRYINMGESGSQVPTLVANRDQGLSWANQLLTGQNVVAVEIGTNDLGYGQTAAQTYASIVAYLNTASTGLLQRGWTVRQIINIASRGALKQADLLVLRGLLRSPTFLTATLTNTGQAYAGKLSRVEAPLITIAGQTIFATDADAANTTYYLDSDGVHPTAIGAVARALGGDTPQYGIVYGL